MGDLGVRQLLAFNGWEAVANWLLVFVFATSGIAKLREPIPAAVAMMNFGVARAVRPASARALGGGEGLLGVALAFGLKYALGIAAALLVVFAFLIVRALLRGQRFSCGCYGSTDSPLSSWTLVRTVALFSIAAAAFYQLNRHGTDILGAQRLIAAVAGAAVFAVVVLVGRTVPLLRWNTIRPARREALNV